jgi:hypothetical protein
LECFFFVQTNDGERYLVTLEIPESTGVFFTHQLGLAIIPMYHQSFLLKSPLVH